MSESLGSRLGTSQTQDFVLLAALALGGYFIYQIVQGIKATAGAAGAAYKGAKTLAAPVANALAQAWIAMIPSSGMTVLGNVIFPDGSKVPLSQMTVKQDTLGNVYVGSPVNGLLFQLQPSNTDGDWPAVQITDPSQIGTSAQNTAPDFGVTNTTGWS